MEAVSGNAGCVSMRKAWIYFLAVAEASLKWVFAFAAATACLLTPYGVPIAIGFMAVTASTLVEDPYLKVVVAAGGSVVAMWLVLNVMEAAIILTAWRFKKLIDRYIFHLERSIEGEPIIVPITMEGFA